MKKEKYFKKALDWVQGKRFLEVKANTEGFETPKKFTKPKEDKPYIPDIVCKKTGKKYYIEIAMKADNLKRRLSKWKLLSTLARIKGGKLYLLAPRGHKSFTERMVEKQNLNAEVVYIG